MTEIEVDAVGEEPPVSIDAVRRAARAVLDDATSDVSSISITFLPAENIAALNETHFRKKGATDVIAFGMRHDGGLVGDVYICPEVARRNAIDTGTSFDVEILRLVIHGSLHVLGYSHPEDGSRTRSEMWLKQEAYLRAVEENAGES